MWITKIALICCLATATLGSSESKSKTKSSTELRGKRNLEYSIAHPNPVFGYRTERRLSTGHRNNYYPTHKHYITFRRGRPSPSLPPYAVQMEPLVHYSQRDPLYDGNNIPLNTGNDLVSDYQHIHPQTYGVPAPPPKIIEKPIYIKEPEPIIEIIIKESNVTLPPPPAPEIVTPAPKKKEPVHVFYVKYKKNPNGYGKDSIIYDKPIPAISPPVEDEEPQQEEPPQPQYYPPPATPAPQTPSTTLRAIIKPESDYSGNKHIHIRFEKEQNDQYKRASTNDDDSKEESAPEPVISQPQSRKFIFPPGLPQSRSPPNFSPKVINRPPPQFRPEGPRFAPPPPPPSSSQYRPFNQPPQFKSQPFPPNQFPPQPVRSNFQPPHISIDRPPAPPVQQELPSHQHIPFRQPVAYKPFENYISNEVPNQQPPPSFAPSQVHRPINTFDHNLNQPPQSFSNFLTHFPEQQHLPHAQRHHIFHTSRPQEQPPPPQFSSLPDQQEVPHAQKQHQFNSHPPHRLPEESKQLIHSNKEQFNHHQQFNQEQKFEFNHNNQQPQNYQHQSSPFLSQLPRLPQHQLLPTPQRPTNFNSPNQQNYQQQQQVQHHQQQLQHHEQQLQHHQQQLQHHQQQPQHLQLPQHHQQQQPQLHEEIVPPGGQLIPSVSKFEQHITLPSETKEQQTNYQPAPQEPQQQQQQLNQQQRYTIHQQQQLNNQPVRSFEQPSSQQFQHQRLQQTQIAQQQQQQQFIQNSQQQQNNYVQYQAKPTEQRANSPDTTSNHVQKDALRQAITNSPHRFSSVYPTTTSRTTYQSTTTASTSTTKDPQKEEKAKKNVLELPDEVPEDLRQQLLSSGILENAQISVLDYDKVGDIPLSALPPEQLSQFFGAGGKDAISSGSEPIPSIIRKDGDPMEDFQVDQESEGSEAVEQKISPPQIKVVEFDKEKDSEESFVKANSTQSENIQVDSEKYTRYLPIKVNGSRFPIPDVSELKNKNITSVVVLAPVEYSGNKDQPVKETVSNERMLAGQALKELIQNPTAEIFEKWIDIENKTSIDKQSVILLVTESKEAKEDDQKEIFMYDLNTKAVSKLSGELSSAFVNAAEANTHKDLEAIAPSNIIETRVPYPANIDRQDVAFSDDEFSYDLSDAPSEVVESRIPIIDPMDEKDEYEAEASEQLEQFIDISGLRVRPEDLAAAASENRVIVSSGYSKTGSNKMPSSR